MQTNKRKYVLQGFLIGIGMTLGIAFTTVLGVVVNGTINSFSSGQTVSSSTLNENFASLKTAIESIDPQFSGSETATHKVWTNGKTIYRKVINVGALPNSGTSSTAHGISGGSIISLSGFATNGTLTYNLPHSQGVNDPANNIEIYTDATNVYVITSAAVWSGFNGTVILTYTK